MSNGVGDIRTFYQNTEVLCLDRLREALDRKTGLFSRQLRHGRWEPTMGTEEMTSTAICLISICRSGTDPKRIDLDCGAAMDALVESGRRLGYRGGAGLVIWANAVTEGPPLSELLRRLNVSLKDATGHVAQITTMETAWLVSGLAHEYSRDPSEWTRRMLGEVVEGLLSRFDPQACLFHHASESAPLKHRLRRHLPNFADQIYPVQACSHAGAVGVPQALRAAGDCAARLVELQGELGQWWWHYNSRTGAVAQPYPVYSVHQHAMAPMALMGLTAAGGEDFTAAIVRSLAWISDNELGVDLLDGHTGTIWRDIEVKESSPRRLVRTAGSLLGGEVVPDSMSADDLTVNYETRPYEWGWCMFAGALACGVEAEHFLC